MRTVGRFMMAGALLFAVFGIELTDADRAPLAWAAESDAPGDQAAPGVVARRNDQAGPNPDRGADGASTELAAYAVPDEEFVHLMAPYADLAVQNVSAASYQIDEALTYTVTVANEGPVTATGTRLRVSFSKGAAYQVAVPSQGSCASVDAVVTCDLGRIANGGTVTVTIQVTPIVAYLVTSTAEVSGLEFDPDRANNRASQAARSSRQPTFICPAGVPV